MIQDLFHQYIKMPSDINEHLAYLHNFCVEHNIQQIVELGVRGGASTVAFLAAMEKTNGLLWSCDIQPPWPPAEVLSHPQWTFHLGDDLEPTTINAAPPCDLLFIDTTHEYEQTLHELTNYVPLSRFAVMLHDTHIEHMPWLKNQPPFPVMSAIMQFLSTQEDKWQLSERPFNNGLVTLIRS